MLPLNQFHYIINIKLGFNLKPLRALLQEPLPCPFLILTGWSSVLFLSGRWRVHMMTLFPQSPSLRDMIRGNQGVALFASPPLSSLSRRRWRKSWREAYNRGNLYLPYVEIIFGLGLYVHIFSSNVIAQFSHFVTLCPLFQCPKFICNFILLFSFCCDGQLSQYDKYAK